MLSLNRLKFKLNVMACFDHPAPIHYEPGVTSHDSSKNATLNLAAIRAKYLEEAANFTEEKLTSLNPYKQFTKWMEDAVNDPSVEEANAMCLSTASAEGRPSSRYVLCKGFDEAEGFKFFTNYGSRKAKQMFANPYVSLVFYWEALHRSVRVEGKVKKLPAQESDDYFHSRPRTSQIGALVSAQSTPITGRSVLIQKNNQLEEQFKDEAIEIPRPDCWGGLVVEPEMIEFWQGQSNRIHDRIVFYTNEAEGLKDVPKDCRRDGENGWIFTRLSP